MRKLVREITIDKEKHGIDIREYETLTELMQGESATAILECFNYRSAQLQAQEWRKKLKPRRIPKREKLSLAFNLFSREELENCCGSPDKYNELMNKKLEIIESQIKEGTIL